MSDSVQTKTDTVKLTIDGRAVEVPKGTLVIEAARKLEIEIPFFCYHQKLKSDGNCRMCLVAVEKMPKLQVSCSLPVSEGMVVHTGTTVVQEARKGVLDFLLANHPLDCPICDEGGRCPLQNYSQKYTGYGQYKEEKRIYEKDFFSPLIEKEMNRCIQCMRCVRYCDEVIDSKALASVNRGYHIEIGHYAEKPLDCEFCGGCVQICPVGALLNRLPLYEYRPWMLTRTETTCAYCADGCSLRLESRPQTREVIEVTSFWGNETKTVWGKGRNEGDLCAKGYFGYPFVNSPKRLTKPLVREAGRRDAPLVETSWEEALERVAEGFGRIKGRHGGAAVGALASARCTNENLYVFQKFVRLVLGSPNVDSSVRYGMVNAARALTELVGTPRWLSSYEEIAGADLIFLIGTDITHSNPIVGLKVKAAAKKGAKLIVGSPLRPRISTLSHIVNLATRHLAHRPGAERAVAIGMVKAALEQGKASAPSSIAPLREAVSKLSSKQIESAAGLGYDEIRAAVSEWTAASRAVIVFGESIVRARDGYETVRVLGDLALLTGKLTAEGCGLAPLYEENNEMGAYEMGCVPDRLPGLGRLDLESDRERVQRAWKETIPTGPGLTMIEMLRAAREGRIRALYLMGENPVGTLPASAGAAEALAAAEFVVSQDLFLTETGKRADVVLPAASFAEQNGTFTNQEGRVQPVRKAIEPVHGARPDFEILSQIAFEMGHPLAYQDGAEISHEIARLWPACRPGGPGWREIPGRSEPAVAADGYLGGRLTEGISVRYRLDPAEKRPASSDGRFDLVMGPLLFHSGKMSLKADGLTKIQDRPFLYMAPEDAERFGVSEGGAVRLRSTSGPGSVDVAVRVDGKYPPGMVFFPESFNEPPVKDLLTVELDKESRVPTFKTAEVIIEKIT
ncbi:MAG TPA: NADH-quinone oxidoreductase subunit NuoG [Nitrospiria bacterium]|nr:NADH-quinone oxidoreductase subunit NuoG [Nitrospiria bacterium]